MLIELGLDWGYLLPRVRVRFRLGLDQGCLVLRVRFSWLGLDLVSKVRFRVRARVGPDLSQGSLVGHSGLP